MEMFDNRVKKNISRKKFLQDRLQKLEKKYSD